jgi:hypothetical protein
LFDSKREWRSEWRKSDKQPFAPFVIRWGPDTSSDALRKNLCCKACGHRGASLLHPSWVDIQIGWQPFPTEGECR